MGRWPFKKYSGIWMMPRDMAEHLNKTAAEIRPGIWVLARPLPFYRRWGRFKAAWMVFTGEADALKWEGQ